MASIGTLGNPRPEAEPLDFGYFGETVRVDPGFNDADVMDLLEEMGDIDAEDPRVLASMKRLLRRCIHPEDFDQFWSLGRANRQTVQDRIEVMQSIAAAVAQRPTSRPTDSSAGPPATPTSSGDGSSSRVLSQLEGRRDLQLIVSDTVAARQGAGTSSVAS